MSFGLSRSFCRLSPQIRNVGFQQQVRKNSTRGEGGVDLWDLMNAGVAVGAFLGSGYGLSISRDRFVEEETFSGKFRVCLFELPVITGVCGCLGGSIVGLWPITVPVAAFCYLASEKEGRSSSGVDNREKREQRVETLTKKLSEIKAELSKKA
jgi:hypothetical protein